MPPDTGASRNSAEGQDSWTDLRTSREALASIVEVSRNSFLESFGQPESRPVEGSWKTIWTALACGREVIITSYQYRSAVVTKTVSKEYSNV